MQPEEQMRMFLRYMADLGFQVGVGENVGVNQHQSTVSIHVYRVMEQIIAKQYPRCIASGLIFQLDMLKICQALC